MKWLALLRHAEAEPARPDISDFDRPLSARGRAEAADVARCVALAGLHIDAWLVSPALRTRETAQILAEQLGIPPPVRHFEPSLYLGTPEALWRSLRRRGEQHSCLLMVGHNPGLSEFARQSDRGDKPVELPTAGLCIVEFAAAASWARLRPELATLCRRLR